MLSPTFPDNFDDEVVYALERQLVPCWERSGFDHLVVATPTLSEFYEQNLPERVNAWKGKLESRKTLKRHSFPVVKHWPEADLHRVGFPCLIFVRAGQAEYRVADYVVQCPQDHFILLPPGVPRPAGNRPFLEEPRTGKYCELLWFQPSGIEGKQFMTVFATKSTEEVELNSGHYYIVNDQRIAQLFQYAVEEIFSNQGHPSKPAGVMLHAFLMLVLQEMKAGRYYDRGQTELPKMTYGSTSPIGMAQQYIERNLNHPLTIDSVAQAVFMARTSFLRQFKAETGMNFHDYLTEKRLSQALLWLEQGGFSISSIASLVGLKQSRFHELFRERYGMTPLEYRKRDKSD
jgi:AraC-like DNA-binding protein